MAKYQRQGTNKYYGAGNAGYVSSGSSVDGLAKSLQNAGYQIGKAEELRIDRKKDGAIAKIDEMVANGKSFETIQAEIIKGDHPELTGKYIDATTNYHAGRVKAEEVKNNIVAAQNNGEYDITDESSNLDMFFKKFMPDTKSMDTSTLLGFTSNFNEFRATAVTQDANNRADQALKKKNEEGIKILDGIQTSELKSKLPSFIEKLQIPLPSRDGSNKSNLLYTNEETMNVLKDSVRFLIADAKTEDDLDRVDILLNTNLGYSKKGSAIGTLASRKSDEMNAIKKDLERTRRTLIDNDRQVETRETADRIKALTTKMLVNKVEVTDENGNVTTRPLNEMEKQDLKDAIRREGDMQLLTMFVKTMAANPYYDNDPEVFNNLIVMIRDDQVQDRADIAKLINDNNIAPENQAKLYEAYDNSILDDNKKLHLVNTSYVMGTQAIENKLAQVLAPVIAANPDGNLLKVAQDSVNAHLIVEIYDFEKDYYEEAEANGKKRLKPSNEERAKFMERKLKDIERQYKDAQDVVNLKTFDQQEEDLIEQDRKAKEAEANKLADEKLKDEANEATKRASGFYETFNAIVEAIPNIDIEIPEYEPTDSTTTLKEGSQRSRGQASFMESLNQSLTESKVMPLVEQALTSIIPDNKFNLEFFQLIPQEQGDEMIASISEKLNVPVETIEQAIENIINRPKETPRIRSGNR
jgi:hypothetical protein